MTMLLNDKGAFALMSGLTNDSSQMIVRAYSQALPADVNNMDMVRNGEHLAEWIITVKEPITRELAGIDYRTSCRLLNQATATPIDTGSIVSVVVTNFEYASTVGTEFAGECLWATEDVGLEQSGAMFEFESLSLTTGQDVKLMNFGAYPSQLFRWQQSDWVIDQTQQSFPANFTDHKTVYVSNNKILTVGHSGAGLFACVSNYNTSNKTITQGSLVPLHGATITSVTSYDINILNGNLIGVSCDEHAFVMSLSGDTLTTGNIISTITGSPTAVAVRGSDTGNQLIIPTTTAFNGFSISGNDITFIGSIPMPANASCPGFIQSIFNDRKYPVLIYPDTVAGYSYFTGHGPYELDFVNNLLPKLGTSFNLSTSNSGKDSNASVSEVRFGKYNSIYVNINTTGYAYYANGYYWHASNYEASYKYTFNSDHSSVFSTDYDRTSTTYTPSYNTSNNFTPVNATPIIQSRKRVIGPELNALDYIEFYIETGDSGFSRLIMVERAPSTAAFTEGDLQINEEILNNQVIVEGWTLSALDVVESHELNNNALYISYTIDGAVTTKVITRNTNPNSKLYA